MINRLLILGSTFALVVVLLIVKLSEVTQPLETQVHVDELVPTPATTPVSQTEDLPPQPTNESQTSTTEESGLRLELTTEKQRYVLGEPISLTLTIHNIQDTPKSLHMLLEPYVGAVAPQIRYETGEYEYYGGPGFGIVDYILGDPISLAPGKTWVERRKILYEPLEDDPKEFYALSQVGTYSLRMVLDNIVPDEQLTTAAVKIEVVAPTGWDQQIWRLLQTKDTAAFLHNTYVPNPERVIADFNAILAQYPDSFYAPYLRGAIEHYRSAQTTAPAQTSAAEPRFTIHEIDDQLYFVQSKVDRSVGATNSVDEAVLSEILDTVEAWVDAWNKRDFDGYAQIHSRQSKTWQDWQTGPESFTYFKLNDGVQSLFSSTGNLTIEITGFTVGTDEVIVDVIPIFTGRRFIFNGMRFIQDEDDVWRLASLE